MIGIKRALRISTSIMLSAGLTGCSINPLPEDVAESNTVQIVKRIRCETQRAISGELWKKLHPEIKIIPDEETIEKEAKQRAATLFVEYDSIKNLKDNKESRTKIKTDLEYILIYLASAVTYEFNLTMTEKDSQSISASLSDIIGVGKISIVPSASQDLTRENQRDFKITETFDALRTAECKYYPATISHIRYPITGEIGISEFLHTFYELYASGDFKVNKNGSLEEGKRDLAARIGAIVDPPPPVKPAAVRKKTDGQKPPCSCQPDQDKETEKEDKKEKEKVNAATAAITTAYQFTTLFAGGLGPEWSRSTSSNDFRLIRLTATANASRTDKHTVKISLSKPVFNADTNTPDADATKANSLRANQLYNNNRFDDYFRKAVNE